MAEPTYPASDDAVVGEKPIIEDVNKIRKDTLYLGSVAADAKLLGDFLARYTNYVVCEVLGTTQIRIIFSTEQPPTLMINGYMLLATANVDSPAATGGAGTRYIKAVRTAGSTTFTITVSDTSATEADDERVIGEFEWDGSAIEAASIQSYENNLSLGGIGQQLVKAWASVAANGVADDSYNISAIAHSTTGIYTIFIDVNMANALWAGTATPFTTGTQRFAIITAKSASSLEIRTYTSATLLDVPFMFIIIGD